MSVRQYIGARYVTKIYENSLDPSSAEWEAGVTYEPLTLVTYLNGSYLSKKEVPGSVGDPAANPAYWVVTGSYNGQIAQLQAALAKSYLASDSKIITVAKNGGGMFDNINDAITAARAICSPSDRVTVLVFAGTYNEEIELLQNPGIDIVGIGKPEVQYASIYPHAPLHTTGTGFFSGINFTALDSSTPSYGLHIEALEDLTPAAANITFENCNFIAMNQAGTGIGLGTDFLLVFKNCGFASATGSSFYCHNYPNNASGQYIRMYDCQYNSAAGNADVYVTDANIENGGNIGDSYFNIVITNGSASNNKVALKVGGTTYKYFADNVSNLITGKPNTTRAIPGADYFLREREYTTDVYFSGAYAAIPCIDEFVRSYTVSAINPIDSSVVAVTATIAGSTLALNAGSWSGGPLRVTIKGIIDI